MSSSVECPRYKTTIHKLLISWSSQFPSSLHLPQEGRDFHPFGAVPLIGHSGTVASTYTQARGLEDSIMIHPQLHRSMDSLCLALPQTDSLVGLVVKASALRAEVPGFESCLRQDFSRVESYQRLQNWHSSGYPARRLVL